MCEREREREREEEIGSRVFCYHHHHVIWFTVTALQNNVKNIFKKDIFAKIFNCYNQQNSV